LGPRRIDVVDSLARVLAEHGHSVVLQPAWLQHRGTGFVFQPQLAGVHSLEDGGVRTVTLVRTSHPNVVPNGVFEYQHATGDNLRKSVGNGFEQWAQLDLIPLLDALRPKAESCMTWEMTFPQTDRRQTRIRRAVLGPVAHFMASPPAVQDRNTSADKGETVSSNDEHPFRACCLLTKSFTTFKKLFEDEAFFGVRLFAARDGMGSPQADCRVNGEDWETGANALRECVRRWPGAGYEFRKQYVVLQTIENPQTADE
jgi:hypothetical protein